MCRDNPVMYYDPSGYTSTGTGGYEIGSLEEMKKRVQNWIRGPGIKEDGANAKTPEGYLRKVDGFARTAKKGSSKSRVSGAVEGVIQYKKNGKYIDLVPDGSIISFGRQ